jgi:hypothetical protein
MAVFALFLAQKDAFLIKKARFLSISEGVFCPFRLIPAFSAVSKTFSDSNAIALRHR